MLVHVVHFLYRGEISNVVDHMLQIRYLACFLALCWLVLTPYQVFRDTETPDEFIYQILPFLKLSKKYIKL